MQHEVRVKRIRERLIEKAKARELIEYGEFINGHYGVARGQGAPWQIGTVLGEICKNERSQGRPLLCAICVLKSTGMPSKGFWKGPTYEQARKRGVSKQDFWESEVNEVYDYWQKHDA